MPRVSKCAAAVLALVFATCGIATVVAISISSPRSAEIGANVPVAIAMPGGANQTVYLFAGTGLGTTVVSVGASEITIPVAGNVFGAGTASLVRGRAIVDAAIPSDPALVGQTAIWVAVVVDDSTGRVVAIASAGGPIIQDAIC